MKFIKTLDTLTAIANASRFTIVMMALKDTRLTRQDVLKSFGKSQQNMDRHIKILLKNGIIVYGPKHDRMRTLQVAAPYAKILNAIMKLNGE